MNFSRKETQRLSRVARNVPFLPFVGPGSHGPGVGLGHVGARHGHGAESAAGCRQTWREGRSGHAAASAPAIDKDRLEPMIEKLLTTRADAKLALQAALPDRP